MKNLKGSTNGGNTVTIIATETGTNEMTDTEVLDTAHPAMTTEKDTKILAVIVDDPQAHRLLLRHLLRKTGERHDLHVGRDPTRLICQETGQHHHIDSQKLSRTGGRKAGNRPVRAPGGVQGRLRIVSGHQAHTTTMLPGWLRCNRTLQI